MKLKRLIKQTNRQQRDRTNVDRSLNTQMTRQIEEIKKIILRRYRKINQIGKRKKAIHLIKDDVTAPAWESLPWSITCSSMRNTWPVIALPHLG